MLFEQQLIIWFGSDDFWRGSCSIYVLLIWKQIISIYYLLGSLLLLVKRRLEVYLL